MEDQLPLDKQNSETFDQLLDQSQGNSPSYLADIDKVSQFALLEHTDEPITSDAFIQTQVKYLNFDWFSLQTRIR